MKQSHDGFYTEFGCQLPIKQYRHYRIADRFCEPFTGIYFISMIIILCVVEVQLPGSCSAGSLCAGGGAEGGLGPDRLQSTLHLLLPAR